MFATEIVLVHLKVTVKVTLELVSWFSESVAMILTVYDCKGVLKSFEKMLIVLLENVMEAGRGELSF